MKHSVLHDRHLAAGAKLSEFGGWEMPLVYPEGTLFEHNACRRDAAAFDVSHLGTLKVGGADAFSVLQWSLTNDLERIKPGQAQYTHLLDPTEAWVIDDIIVWWLPKDSNADSSKTGSSKTDTPATDLRFRVLPNASNTTAVANILRGVTDPGGNTGGQTGSDTDRDSGNDKGSDSADNAAGRSRSVIEVHDITSNRALIAIQGPNARQRLSKISPEAAGVARFGVGEFTFCSEQCYVAGTGYTGEDGVECEIPATVAGKFWDSVVEAGIAPAGLGARDLLRLEAGFPLHGHELGPGITPLNARLGWVVGWDKPDFRGKAPLVAQREAKVKERILGVVAEGRRPLRAGQEVKKRGHKVGVVTSGSFSPVLERGIAFAMLSTRAEIGDEVEVGDKNLSAEIIKPPFI